MSNWVERYEELRFRAKRFFEYFFILPVRYFRQHIKDYLNQRQTCKVCGQVDGFNFYVPDDVWEAVVPPKFRTRVVCLRCFDQFAAQKGINIRTHVKYLCFAGEAACFEWPDPLPPGGGYEPPGRTEATFDLSSGKGVEVHRETATVGEGLSAPPSAPQRLVFGPGGSILEIRPEPVTRS